MDYGILGLMDEWVRGLAWVLFGARYMDSHLLLLKWEPSHSVNNNVQVAAQGASKAPGCTAIGSPVAVVASRAFGALSALAPIALSIEHSAAVL